MEHARTAIGQRRVQKELATWLLADCVSLRLIVPAGAAETPANSKAALIVYDASGNQSLDPAKPQSTSGLAQPPLIAIYDSLVGLSDTGTLQPRLATSWKYNQDLTEFTLTSRTGATFHDGTKFNAAAVAP